MFWVAPLSPGILVQMPYPAYFECLKTGGVVNLAIRNCSQTKSRVSTCTPSPPELYTGPGLLHDGPAILCAKPSHPLQSCMAQHSAEVR